MNKKLGGSLVVAVLIACSQIEEQPIGDTVGDGGEAGSAIPAGSSGKASVGGKSNTGGQGGRNAGGGGKDAGGGSTSTAGKGGSAGADAGAGGTTSNGGAPPSCADSNDCPEVDFCGPYPLEQLCALRANACPTRDALLGQLSNSPSVDCYEVQPTDCGIEVTVGYNGLGNDMWGFAPDGELIQRRASSDVVETCPEGTTSSSAYYWGSLPCAAVGPAAEYCNAGGAGAGGAGGAPNSN